MPRPRMNPAATSEGKCAPRKTRSHPTARTSTAAAATSTRRACAEVTRGHSRNTITEAKTAMFRACPDGNENPGECETGSVTTGRALWTTSLEK